MSKRAPKALNVLCTAEPYRDFVTVARALFPDALRPRSLFDVEGIAEGAIVHPTAEIEDGVTIDPGAVIGPRAAIGEGTVIGATAVIGPDVQLGRNCSVGPGASVMYALIGDNVILHAGCRIGQDGFRYHPSAAGHVKVPQLGRVARFFGKRAPSVVPPVLAATTFLGGAILLISGATPAVHSRLAWLNALLPLPVIELSHFLGSIAGVALLVLARGLQRRLDAAYHLTVIVLASSIVFQLFKGADYEEALILTVMVGRYSYSLSVQSASCSINPGTCVWIKLSRTCWPGPQLVGFP